MPSGAMKTMPNAREIARGAGGSEALIVCEGFDAMTNREKIRVLGLDGFKAVLPELQTREA